MKNYLISYDLHKQGQNYTDLIKTIEEYCNATHLLGSVWFIKSNQDSQFIRDHLLRFMDANDELIVTEMAKGNSAWSLEPNKSHLLLDLIRNQRP